jgi:hypothetical protein
MIHFFAMRGEYLFQQFLDLWGKPTAEHAQVIHYQDLPALTRFERGTYVFSGLDQLTPSMTRLVQELHAKLLASGVRVLNDPERTLRRYALLETLAREGRNDFRAVRAADGFTRLRYPAFVRAERTHDGALSPLLHSPAEVEAAIGRQLAYGRSLDELLVVEFCDTADAAGYYRKYAAFAVGNRVIARSLEYGRTWVLKRAGTEYSREMALEEQEYVRTNPHEAQLAEIFALAGVEYGRIDYSVKDGRVQTWEINLNPTIGRGLRPSKGRVPPALNAIREETKQEFYARFNAAFAKIDDGGSGELPIVLDPATRNAATVVPVKRNRFGKALRFVAREYFRDRGAPVFRAIGKIALRRAVRDTQL